MTSRILWRLAVWLFALGGVSLLISLYIEVVTHGFSDVFSVLGDGKHHHVFLGLLSLFVGALVLVFALRAKREENVQSKLFARLYRYIKPRK